MKQRRVSNSAVPHARLFRSLQPWTSFHVKEHREKGGRGEVEERMGGDGYDMPGTRACTEVEQKLGRCLLPGFGQDRSGGGK